MVESTDKFWEEKECENYCVGTTAKMAEFLLCETELLGGYTKMEMAEIP